MKQAAVAAENRTFWTDQGISIRGMVRAAWTIARGGDVQGGSTITQQYIKILYLNSERTLTRKFRELFLAYKINKEMSKEEILAGYLNTIYLRARRLRRAGGQQGILRRRREEAHRPAGRLPCHGGQQPEHVRPVRQGRSPAHPQPLPLCAPLHGRDGLHQPRTSKPRTPRSCRSSRRSLPTSATAAPKASCSRWSSANSARPGFDSSQISGGGLKIITTFDKDAQQAAVEAAQKYTKQSARAVGRKASKLHAALASVDVNSGEVIALYGGPDYVKNSRNWATTPRPTASTFKAYALAAGLKDGFSLRNTFNGNTWTPPGDRSPVRNEFSHQYGQSVDLIKATADSINTAFVDLTTQMDNGPRKIMKMAQAVGAPKGRGWDNNDRVPLGTAEVSPLAQASAYATFANDGVAVPDHVVREVRDRKGKVIYEAQPEKERAVTEDIAHDVTFALSRVVEQGTGRTVQTLERPVAGQDRNQGPVQPERLERHRLGLVRRLHQADLHSGDVRRRQRRQW